MKQLILLICLLLSSPLLAQSQTEKPFQHFENWKAVLSEAKAKKKNIFIDAYTTWCGPCKQMDKEVYTSPDIMGYIDSNFIAVKVQMDQSPNDSPEIKAWYNDAKLMMANFNIKAFPSFIFLDTDGNLIQVYLGYQPVAEFLSTLKEANDPQKSFSNQIGQYKKGKITAKALLTL